MKKQYTMNNLNRFLILCLLIGILYALHTYQKWAIKKDKQKHARITSDNIRLNNNQNLNQVPIVNQNPDQNQIHNANPESMGSLGSIGSLMSLNSEGTNIFKHDSIVSDEDNIEQEGDESLFF